MKYPETQLNRSPSPVFKAVDAIAKREIVSHGFSRKNNKHGIGQFCLDLVRVGQDDRQKQRQLVKSAKRKRIDQAAPALFQMIEFQNSTSYLEKAAQDAHKSSILRLRKSLSDFSKEDADHSAIGAVTENVFSALLTRYAHPWIVTFPAFMHHEADGNNGMHYDIGLVIDGDSESSSHLLQVKTKCLGVCGDSHGKRELSAESKRYKPDIQLLSGCCHLQQDTGNIPRIAQQLITEFSGTPGDSLVKELDVITDGVLFNVSADLLPRGRAQDIRGGSV